MIMKGYLAIDYGSKRTGLASSDDSGIAIANLEALATKAPDFMKRLSSVIRDRNPGTVIIGRPQQTDGEDSILQDQLDKLRESLLQNFPDINILFFDERYTSKIAERIWQEKQGGRTSGIKKQQKKKEELDSLAAHVLLRSYLDSLL